MGMVRACRLAEWLGLFPTPERERFEALCQEMTLPMAPPSELEPLQLLRLMRHDKKASAGTIRLVLPVEKIGRVTLKDGVPDETILSVL